MNEIMVYAGSIIVMGWGAAHIVPVRSVVGGFGHISDDNRKIIMMEWVAEGLALLFIGFLALLVTLTGELQNVISLLVIRVSAVMLLVLAGVSAMTGAQTRILPMKVCPLVKTACAVLFIAGTAI